MIPILYRGDETSFTSNGLGRLTDCSSCAVTEERNGIYECTFVYPVTGRFYQEMTENGGTVGVIHDDHHDIQPFDIYAYSAPIDGLVTFKARHISYRLNRIPVKPFTAGSCALALAGIKSHSMTVNPFTFWTDKNVVSDYELKTPQNARDLLVGQEGSILDVYGTGEYKFDLFAVNLYTNRGTDTGVTIRYGKNLTSIDREYDGGETYTAVAPFWTDGDTVVTLPEGFVQSATPPTKSFPWQDNNGNDITDDNGEVIYFQAEQIQPVSLDLSSKFGYQPSVAELRQAAQNYLANNTPWLPQDNIEIDFVALWQTPEYESVASLQRVGLCDKVSVYYPALGVTQENQKVISVTYNVLLERYDSIQLGTMRQTLAQALVGDLHESVEKLAQEKVSYGALDLAVAHATKLISGGLGGHVVLKLNPDGEPEELLIMDTDSVDTAVNVWRWNQGGLGHSHSGYNGPYDDVALTMDGRINASMITAGQLNANYIHGGTLSLGGQDNQSGIWVVNDENGNEVARGDKDGVTSKALTATKYVYLNGDPGSYFKMPLSNTSPADYYILISNSGSNLPVEIRGKVYSGGGYKKIGSFIDGSGITIKYDINQNTSQIWSSLTANGLSLSKNGGSDAADYGVSAIHLQNGDISISTWYDAQYGRNYELNLGGDIDISFIENDGSGFPSAQVYLDAGGVTAGLHIAQGQAYLALGSTVLTEAKLQQLLALI